MSFQGHDSDHHNPPTLEGGELRFTPAFNTALARRCAVRANRFHYWPRWRVQVQMFASEVWGFQTSLTNYGVVNDGQRKWKNLFLRVLTTSSTNTETGTERPPELTKNKARGNADEVLPPLEAGAGGMLVFPAARFRRFSFSTARPRRP